MSEPLNLKAQFRYLVEHGVSDHGNSIGEACDKAYDIMLPKLIAVALLFSEAEETKQD